MSNPHNKPEQPDNQYGNTTHQAVEKNQDKPRQQPELMYGYQKHPWQMTYEEWSAEYDKLKCSWVPGNYTRASKSQEVDRMSRIIWLHFDVGRWIYEKAMEGYQWALDEIDFPSRGKEKHELIVRKAVEEGLLLTCSCGGGEGNIHPLGEGGCLRYHVTDLEEIPYNRRKVDIQGTPNFVWDIGDTWVTEYTLLNQRMYAQHPDGSWSRPKSKDSINSL